MYLRLPFSTSLGSSSRRHITNASLSNFKFVPLIMSFNRLEYLFAHQSFVVHYFIFFENLLVFSASLIFSGIFLSLDHRTGCRWTLNISSKLRQKGSSVLFLNEELNTANPFLSMLSCRKSWSSSLTPRLLISCNVHSRRIKFKHLTQTFLM